MWPSVCSGYTVTTKSRWSDNQRTWTLALQTLRFHGQLHWRSALVAVWLGRHRHLILSSDTIIKICHALALSYNDDIFMLSPNPKGCVLHLKDTPLNWRSFPNEKLTALDFSSPFDPCLSCCGGHWSVTEHWGLLWTWLDPSRHRKCQTKHSFLNGFFFWINNSSFPSVLF